MRPRGSHSVEGFTLLEVVVVLAVIGLATALVAPAGFRTIESWRRSTDVDAITGALSGIGPTTRQHGRALQIQTGALPDDVIELPTGWRIELDAPLAVQANGACTASHGRMITDDGYTQAFEIHAPFCRTVRAATPP